MSITPQELRNCATMLEKYGYGGAVECVLAAFEIERLEAREGLFLRALHSIAKQELSSEHEIEDPDYEGGYDTCVTIARYAVSSELWPQHEAGKTTGVVETHERCSTEQPATPLIAQKHP